MRERYRWLDELVYICIYIYSGSREIRRKKGDRETRSTAAERERARATIKPGCTIYIHTYRYI